MERIKDIKQLKLQLGVALIKIHEKERSGIILPDGSENSDTADFAEIILINSDRKEFEPGDIVIEFSTNQAFKWEEETYAFVPVHAIKTAIAPEYFLLDYDISE